MHFAFDNSFHREMEGFYAPAEATAPSAPKLLIFNRTLADRLGLDAADVDDDALAQLFSGGALPSGANPLAFVYAGHQFGHFSSQLGDGRALLLGEIVAPDGARFDLQLKGSGPTPFSRSGDGKAAVGPVLREFLISEAMAAMHVPTTRALAAVATGDPVQRERTHPGAVLTRIASSHIRVGTFQFFAANFSAEHLIKLSDYSIRRHFPDLVGAPNPHLALLERVIARQCALVADWLALGFVHGVMNTDNVAISGETIDYGPCAFIDHFAAETVFSSIDAKGRYAYARQPKMMHWNMARFAEALLPAIHAVDPAGVEAAKAMVDAIPETFREAWLERIRRKLGLGRHDDNNEVLIDNLLSELERLGIDFTGFFRALATLLRGDATALEALLPEHETMAPWIAEWRERLEREPITPTERAAAMDAINPLYIPRNHKVEEALAAAEEGNLAPFHSLLDVVRHPFSARAVGNEYTQPPPMEGTAYVTFCGT